jgi:hypothetical protein
MLNGMLQVKLFTLCKVEANEKFASPQDTNTKNMNTEIVAQMWKNYQSNVQFHLEGMMRSASRHVHAFKMAGS